MVTRLTKGLCIHLLCVASFTAMAQSFPALPEPVSNNAVAQVSTDSGHYFLSFMGLGKGKTHADVHNKVWALNTAENAWKAMKAVPASIALKGRLAATAVGVGKYAYIFGGYTVAADHTEISVPDVYRFDVQSNEYVKLANMPVPVDDSVALNYQDKYIYLVSGWHNDGNVNLVQVYDIANNTWFQASPFLGDAVFGQAAAISGNTMVVCDGVKTVAFANKRRGFDAKAQCLKGIIDSENPAKVSWHALAHPTGKAHYRMAAGTINKQIVFMGGSPNPYNYNGVGYNGKPSSPSSQVWRFDIASNKWQRMEHALKATMDHRGLLEHDGHAYRIGGMGEKQHVLDAITPYRFTF
ncbi:Kelch repeat-containing protein [Pseudoalteromonas sp. SSDWG2]|uniref:Kelch repeat-containing protein n=1 Tax=Pseudoalteromonas sp. SSDWG2 TaxID=3139391 RepID=UPI003BA85392